MPVSPNFAREQIYVSGLQDTYRAGDKATVANGTVTVPARSVVVLTR
mgnify:CR=1 FL=1